MALQLKGSLLLFLKKHRGPAAYALGCVFTSLFFLIRTPYWLLMTLVSRHARKMSLDKTRLCIKGAFKSLGGWRALSVNGR